MSGKLLFITAVAALAAAPGSAKLPMLNATCPGGKEIHADAGGPVFINGKRAALKRINNNFYEATGQGIKLSISVNPDGSATVSWTGRNRANGMCSVKGA
ncbi:hypothetical protein [Sphingomonas jaspsi]|uniref:hypothetical protein n=1 Tax=Sphingomonas jaspsi TaxID=392409 RepID=UPI00055C2A16|nr:hypothetical protein [Sphingomonas jaspsi]